ncbi:MAG: putative DNA-binding domain-containing protein [Deltaproteobacteria bacterium]|nr:putative DNA-binding domain-containing protein [bacterium]MCB9475761.1 putative DNA-binding domain-containing protein [Deltaproteobacteria bacterium]MCB9490320.1 putative DNA-binding domain-containing protein [Deltaproteobacteria bacterium]
MSDIPFDRAALERQTRSMVFDTPAGTVPGLSERGHRVYRRQVRLSVKNGVKLAIPIARKLLGKKTIEAILDRWLNENPPETRLYWELPLQFAVWFAARYDEGAFADLNLPVAAPELMHWECVEVAAINAPDGPSDDPDAINAVDLSNLEIHDQPADDRKVVLHPSARLGVFRHPVHRISLKDAAWPEASDVPFCVLVYRPTGEEYAAWMELDPVTAQALAQAAEGKTLAECRAFLAELHGAAVPWDALLARLDTLRERGAILGYAA